MEMNVCLNCKKELEGRSDKKYCDGYCKSNYNYEKISGKKIPCLNQSTYN